MSLYTRHIKLQQANTFIYTIVWDKQLVTTSFKFVHTRNQTHSRYRWSMSSNSLHLCRRSHVWLTTFNFTIYVATSKSQELYVSTVLRMADSLASNATINGTSTVCIAACERIYYSATLTNAVSPVKGRVSAGFTYNIHKL